MFGEVRSQAPKGQVRFREMCRAVRCCESAASDVKQELSHSRQWHLQSVCENGYNELHRSSHCSQDSLQF